LFTQNFATFSCSVPVVSIEGATMIERERRTAFARRDAVRGRAAGTPRATGDARAPRLAATAARLRPERVLSREQVL
jgi:hypothetical protein